MTSNTMSWEKFQVYFGITYITRITTMNASYWFGYIHVFYFSSFL
jgi:hypothetical protein